MRKIAVMLALCAVAVSAAACVEEGQAEKSKNVGTTAIVVPLDYGNGVYYFDATRAQLANSLSKFLRDHPGARVEAMTGDGDNSYGRDDGYFVVIRLKPEKE